MKKTDIHQVTLMEASSTMLAATLIGFVTGYWISVLSMAVLQKSQGYSVDYSIDWPALLAMTIMSYALVVFGTRICVNAVNQKGIT